MTDVELRWRGREMAGRRIKMNVVTFVMMSF